MNQALAGAVAMGFAVAAIFFVRFWRQTRDRLFALFALAFVLMASNRVVLCTLPGARGDHLYWVRLLAFILILVAILDKNRGRKASA